MNKFQPRIVLKGLDTGREFFMYKTYKISDPKKFYMIHAAFSEKEADDSANKFSVEELNGSPVTTIKI